MAKAKTKKEPVSIDIAEHDRAFEMHRREIVNYGEAIESAIRDGKFNTVESYFAQIEHHIKVAREEVSIIAGHRATKDISPVIVWRSLDGFLNVGATSLFAGHYNTGHPEERFVLYSRGSGDLLIQRTERIFAPKGMKNPLPVREKGVWQWRDQGK